MSEHAWAQEHIAAFVSGGLDASEAERLESHLVACPECASTLSRSREIDSRLASLFVMSRPRPDLEDRAIQAVRLESAPGPAPIPFRIPVRWRKRALIAASVAGVVTAGGIVGSHGGLPMPGNPRHTSRIDVASERAPSAERGEQPEKDLTNDDLGLVSDLEGSLPSLDRVDKQTVEGLITQDNLGQPNAPDADASAKKLPALPEYANFEKMTGLPGVRPTAPANDSVVMVDGSVRSIHGNGYGFGEINSPGPRSANTGKAGKSPSVYGDYYPADQKGEYVSGLKLRPPAAQPFNVPHSQVEKKERVQKEVAVMEKAPVQKGSNEVGTDAPSVHFPPSSTSNGQTSAAQPAPAPNAAAKSIVIRTGEIEFVIDSFDSAAATIAKIAGSIKGAVVGNTSSQRLDNGKVKGSITVRLPPEQLDGLILDLRRELGKDGGELRGSRLNSQDITKQYTDLESRLKAARTTEQRLLQIIKEGGKGDIKGLVEAEQALGKYQTQIEEMEGEIRYYANQVALSTLTITLAEKDIKAAAGLTENERVRAGIEVEDVEKTQRQLLDAVAEAKGRVTKSELKQFSAGQFTAVLNFEAAPAASGPLRDRLRQLGRVARMEIDRIQTPEGTVSKTAKVERGDTLFEVQLYNLVAIAPREVSVNQVAVLNVPTAYHALWEAAARAGARILAAQLNEQDQQNVTAQFDFEVRRAEEPALRQAINALGDVLSRQVTRAAEGESVTDAKVMFRTTILAAAQLKPREKTSLTVEVPDVDQTVVVFGVRSSEVHGRQVDAQFTRDRGGRLTAKLVYEVPLSAAAGLVEGFKSAGTVRAFQSSREAGAPEGKYATARVEVSVVSSERIVGADDGLWPQVRRGLSYSASTLLGSITWVIVGLCVVVPWAIIGYILVKVIRGLFRSNTPVAAPTPPPTV